MNRDARVYEPHSNTGWTPDKWADMARDLWGSRHLAWYMFQRGFVSKYRQTLFGLFGIVLEPVLLLMPFVVLGATGVFQTGNPGVPYVLYALLGQSIWGLFQDGVNQCGNAIAGGGAIIAKINFSKEVLVLAQIGQVLVNILVRLALMAVLFLVYQTMPAWTTIFLPLALLPLLALTLGVGFFLAFANALVRDLGNYVRILLPFLMLMTPIMYVTPKSTMFQTITNFNPLAQLVLAPRDLVLYGHIARPVSFAASSVLAFVVLALGWRVFHLAGARLAERLGDR